MIRFPGAYRRLPNRRVISIREDRTHKYTKVRCGIYSGNTAPWTAQYQKIPETPVEEMFVKWSTVYEIIYAILRASSVRTTNSPSRI